MRKVWEPGGGAVLCGGGMRAFGAPLPALPGPGKDTEKRSNTSRPRVRLRFGRAIEGMPGLRARLPLSLRLRGAGRSGYLRSAPVPRARFRDGRRVPGAAGGQASGRGGHKDMRGGSVRSGQIRGRGDALRDAFGRSGRISLQQDKAGSRRAVSAHTVPRGGIRGGALSLTRGAGKNN